MPKQDAEFLQVLIRQLRQNTEVDRVIGKTLGVLGHAELFEPVSDLLHRRPQADFGATCGKQSLAISAMRL